MLSTLSKIVHGTLIAPSPTANYGLSKKGRTWNLFKLCATSVRIHYAEPHRFIEYEQSSIIFLFHTHIPISLNRKPLLDAMPNDGKAKIKTNTLKLSMYTSLAWSPVGQPNSHACALLFTSISDTAGRDLYVRKHHSNDAEDAPCWLLSSACPFHFA